MRRRDLLDQLLDAAGDGARLLRATSWQDELTDICEAARLAFGSPAVSIARVIDDHLRYEAAAGVSADAIVGVEMPIGYGFGGLAAATGQALVIDDPAADSRFGREVAQRVGFEPRSLLIAPIHSDDGDVIGVITVLDRTVGAVDALEMGAAFARLAASPLINGPLAQEVGRVLWASARDARNDSPQALPIALQRRSGDGLETELVALLGLLGDVRSMDEATRQRVIAVITEVAALARGVRRR